VSVWEGENGPQGPAGVRGASAKLIKGAPTAVTGMGPEGAGSGALKI